MAVDLEESDMPCNLTPQRFKQALISSGKFFTICNSSRAPIMPPATVRVQRLSCEEQNVRHE